MKLQLVTIVMAGLMGVSSLSAQNYYDDDIYYKPSKKKEEVKAQPAASQAQSATVKNDGGKIRVASDSKIVRGNDGNTYIVTAEGNAYPVNAVEVPAADLYTYDSGSTRDVDEYNRRGEIAAPADTLERDAFANTRLIERFSNPEIVSGSGDEDLIQYYSVSQPQEVNIYIDATPSYSYSALYSPYRWSYWDVWDPWYNPYYSYSWYNPWYSPWYNPWYGPSWSWGWDTCWYPHHHHHHHHAWNPGPGRPAVVPNRRSSGRYATSGRYGNNYGSSSGRNGRPAATGSGSYGGGRRSSSSVSGSSSNTGRYSGGTYSGRTNTRPNASTVVSGSGQSGHTPGTSYGGGRRGSSGSSSSGTVRNSGRSNSSNSSSGSYHNSSSSRSSSSGSGRSGGSGGSRSGGGGRSGRR